MPVKKALEGGVKLGPAGEAVIVINGPHLLSPFYHLPQDIAELVFTVTVFALETARQVRLHYQPLLVMNLGKRFGQLELLHTVTELLGQFTKGLLGIVCGLLPDRSFDKGQTRRYRRCFAL